MLFLCHLSIACVRFLAVVVLVVAIIGIVALLLLLFFSSRWCNCRVGCLDLLWLLSLSSFLLLFFMTQAIMTNISFITELR